MTVKVKQAWLDYVHELVPMIDSEDFKETSGKDERERREREGERERGRERGREREREREGGREGERERVSE